MLKYLNAQVVFQEVPNEITLAINITGCKHHCEGCHSPELRKNIGVELNCSTLDSLIDNNEGITCVCFMGGDHDLGSLANLIWHVKDVRNLKVALYTGSENIPMNWCEKLDYLKLGEYKKDLGGLRSSTTNQRFYAIKHSTNYYLEDITNNFYASNKESI